MPSHHFSLLLQQFHHTIPGAHHLIYIENCGISPVWEVYYSQASHWPRLSVDVVFLLVSL